MCTVEQDPAFRICRMPSSARQKKCVFLWMTLWHSSWPLPCDLHIESDPELQILYQMCKLSQNLFSQCCEIMYTRTLTFDLRNLTSKISADPEVHIHNMVSVSWKSIKHCYQITYTKIRDGRTDCKWKKPNLSALLTTDNTNNDR